jgi:hypothetical protein
MASGSGSGAAAAVPLPAVRLGKPFQGSRPGLRAPRGPLAVTTRSMAQAAPIDPSPGPSPVPSLSGRGSGKRRFPDAEMAGLPTTARSQRQNEATLSSTGLTAAGYRAVRGEAGHGKAGLAAVKAEAAARGLPGPAPSSVLAPHAARDINTRNRAVLEVVAVAFEHPVDPAVLALPIFDFFY